MNRGFENLKPSELVPGGFLPKVSRRQKRVGAYNGQTAFTDTAQYRNDTPPSNYPTALGFYFPGGFGNSTTAVQISFSYTQGANIATHFAIYIKYGGGTITASDPHFLVSAGAGGTFYLPFPLSQHGTYSFGVAALAMCKDGPEFNATLATILNQSLGSSVYLGVSGVATLLSGTLYPYGSNGGTIDFNNYGGTFLPRRLAAAATPGTMASGEVVIFPCTSGNTWLIYYDGGNKLAAQLTVPAGW